MKLESNLNRSVRSGMPSQEAKKEGRKEHRV